MKGVSTLAIVLVVVVAVVAGAAVGFLLLKNNEPEPDAYFEFDVSGSYYGATFSGSMKISMYDVDEDQYKVKYDYSVFMNYNGTRERVPIPNTTQMMDKNSGTDDEWGTFQRTTSIVTRGYGTQFVDVYSQDEDGSTMTAYVGESDGIVYRMEMKVTSGDVRGMTLTFDLKNYGPQ